jgi:hypothetical protein
MGVGRETIEIGLCPSPGRRKGKEFRTPVAKEESYDEATNRLTVTIYLLKQGRIAPNRIYTFFLCPGGHICGCDYSADVGWEILDNCGASIFWKWPAAAGCLLKQGSLTGLKSGVLFTEQLSVDPGDVIYPVGDSRNPDCPGCGMSGHDRVIAADTPVPGESFPLAGCFDEETCLETYGAGGCKPIGQKLFQTVGFMGGLIHDVFDEEARVYEVMVDGILTGVKGTDLTKYTIGQWVALAKVNTEFPLDDWGQRAPVTDQNVPSVGVEEYIIVPFVFAGAS